MTAKPSNSRREFLHKLTATIGGTATLALTANTLQAAPQKIAKTPAEPAPAAKVINIPSMLKLTTSALTFKRLTL